MGECLRSDAPDPVAPWAMHAGQAYVHRAWEASACTACVPARPPSATCMVIDVWDYRARHPEQSAIFDRAMSGISRRVAEAVVETCDFGRFRRVVDVGGGEGALLAHILSAHPAMAACFSTCRTWSRGAAPVLVAAGVGERCEVVAGDFLQGVPKGGDAYVLKGILHDWDE